MIGRLEIQRMRREAEERLGDGFAVQTFHAAVLDSGSMPLGVLDGVVNRLPARDLRRRRSAPITPPGPT